MIFQGRNLTQGLTGADVAALHGVLEQLGYPVAPAETQAQQFGATTLVALQQAQTLAGSTANGVVDAASASALEALLRASTFVVSGRVTSAVSAATSGLTVRLVDKNIGGDVVLKTATTDFAGAYSASFVAPPPTLRTRLKTAPDLQAQVTMASTAGAVKVVAVSPVAVSAKSPLTLDVTLPDATTGLPSEYETLTASLSGFYAGRLKDIRENEVAQDVTYLGAKSGWDARAVAMASLADQYSTIVAQTSASSPAATFTPNAPGVSLRPEFYYALFRAGVPSDADALFRTPPATAAAIWTRAAAQGVIPQALATQIADATKAFQTLAGANLATMRPTVGVSTLAELAAPTLKDPLQGQAFASLLAAHAGDSKTLWAEVAKTFGDPAAQRLQLIGKLSYLTLDNAPLLVALDRAEARQPLTAPIDLAARGYWSADKWAPLIGQSIPPGVPGATVAEQTANYSAWLAAQVKLSFPTATLAQQVRSGVIHLADKPAAVTEVADFLTAHQAELAFGVEPIEAYVARMNLSPSKSALFHLKRLQRVHQMTTSEQAMSALIAEKVDSAFAITRYDADGFARLLGNKVGGAAAARAIHARAKQIHGAALNVAMSYATQRVSGGLGRAGGVVGTGAPAAGAQSPAAATLEGLFGSLDTCGCEDCESILSPSAYFVDLLHYLDQPAAPSGANPQTVLFKRRPDLQYLPLTCENTQVALPYIDVANETLEYFVANGLSLQGFQGFDTGSHVKSAELIAVPQNVNDAAYSALQNAFFPSPLPFNRPLELLRGHLKALGVSAPDAMEILRRGDSVAPSPPVGADYSWNDIVIERLRLSRNELRIFVDPGLQLGDLFGLPNASALATLRTMNVHDLVRRAGINYDDLVAILRSRFVNPGAALIPRLERLGAPFATIKALRDNPAAVGPMFIAALPADLDYSQYGGPTATTGQDVVNWLISDVVYLTAVNLITIANPTGGAMDCTGAQLQLRYANPDNSANMLSGTDWLKLVRFIRLWRKLRALLDADDATTIALTDALLAALYPAAQLPAKPWDASTDAANRPMLDAGFLTAIRRAGFAFQAMALLGLDPNFALPSLLACAAPIDTTGAPSFYQSLFDSPSLSAIDPGAQTATLTGALFAGDTLRTTIDGANIDHLVAAAETPAAALSVIAAAIAASATTDPASGVPIGKRFVASISGSSMTVTAGFVVSAPPLSPGATETLTLSAPKPTAQTLTVGGAATPGDLLQFAIDGVTISYAVKPGDTLASIADGLRDAVNATTAEDPACGAALNTIVAASSLNGVVTLTAVGAGAPFALSCSVLTANNGAYAAWIDTAASQKGTAVTGTFAAGAKLTTTINGAPLVYTVPAGATAASIAAAIAAAVNASAAIDPVTGVAVNALVSAAPDASNPAKLIFTPVKPAVGFALAASATTTSYVAQRAASPFADSGYGVVLADSKQTLLAHAPFLSAACNLTGPEFAEIAAAVGFDLSTPLNLANVSVVYRHGWLARALGLSVVEFLRLKQCADLDPFAPLDPGTPPDVAPPLIRFIRLAQAMTSAGLDPVQALYLVWNEDIGGTLAPKSADVGSLALGLRRDFAAVEATFARKDDPDGSIAQGLMALVYGAADAAFFFSLVTGVYHASASFASASPTLPQAAVTASGGRLAYDDGKKLLTFAGYLDAPTLTTIKATLLVNTVDSADKLGPGAGLTLSPAAMANIAPGTALLIDSGANAETIVAGTTGANSFTADLVLAHDGTATPFPIVNDPGLAAALDALGLMNQQTVTPFFARYPELRPLYVSFVASSAPLADRYRNLLASFLPILKRERKAEQALADVSSASGQDVSLAGALLQNANVLHASSDPSTAAIADLTGLEVGGLTAAIHLDGDLGGANPSVFDVTGPVQFAQAALLSGTPTVGATLTAMIAGVFVRYVVSAADADLAALAASVAGAVNAATAIEPVSGLPIGALVLARAAGPAVILTSRTPADPKRVFTLDCSSSAAALGFAPAHAPMSGAVLAQLPADVAGVLPAATGVAGLAVKLQGFVTAPQDGLYDFEVVVDAGAKASLTLGGVAAPLVFGAGTAPNAPVRLAAGTLTPIVLTSSGVKATLTLCWRSSAGIGWQPIPGPYLFSQGQIDRLRDTYVRFLKAASFASALSLKSNEIAYLAFDANRSVATSAKDVTAPGSATFHPASMTGIGVGSLLAIDSGEAREVVQVTSVAATSFAAQTVNAHDGSASPIQIVSAPTADLGHGWLNALPGAPYADPLGAAYPGGADGARLRATLLSVLDFARLKRALSADSDRLLQTLAAPGALLPNGQTALANLTGWRPESVNALLMRFTGATSLAALSDIKTFARVFDGVAIVAACRVSAGVLLGALSNAPTPSAVAALQSALRAQYAVSDWLAVVRPINDALRVAQRDALVAYVLQGFKSKPPAAPYDHVDTPDKLFEYFLMDVENQPAVLTSRIRLALSSTQLFIERVLRGIETEVAPSDIDPQQWAWMKRYRVWQANREVFLWPENWLYPELRDDQSPIFKKTFAALLQSDLTDDAAAEAYLGYLTELEAVAKLEPCGVYYVPASDGSAGGGASDEIAYVVARTSGAHRKHYFRTLRGNSWSPWEEVKIDCEDMPLTPIVWKGRLFLFWLRFLKGQPSDPATGTPTKTGPVSQWGTGDITSYTGGAASAAGRVEVRAVLCWSEYVNGVWRDMKTSDVNRPATLDIPASAMARDFENDRNRIRIVISPYKEFAPPDALVLAILPPNDGSEPAVPYGTGFVLYNTHSLPALTDDIPSDFHGIAGAIAHLPLPLRTLAPSRRYLGDRTPGTFSVNRYTTKLSIMLSQVDSTAAVLGFFSSPRYIEPQIGPGDATDWPFFYEDRRNQFYVTITRSFVPFHIWNLFTVSAATPTVSAYNNIPVLTTVNPFAGPGPDPGPFVDPNEAMKPGGAWSYLGGERAVVAAFPSRASFSFQGRLIGLAGGAPTAQSSIRSSGRG